MQGTLPLLGRWSRAWPVGLLVGAVIGLDQMSKYLVRAHLFLGESVPQRWPVRITHIENTGSAFGLFTDQTSFLIGASILAIGIMLLLYRRAGASSPLFRVSLGLQLGGGISNLADRIRFGEVTDFIDLRVWPVFNIADSSVVIGIALLIWLILFQERRWGAKP